VTLSPVMSQRADSDSNTALVSITGFEETFEFSVAEGTMTDASFLVTSSSLIGLLDSAYAELEVNIDGDWVSLGDSSGGGVVDLVGLSSESAQIDIQDLEAGSYRLTYGTTTAVGALTTVDLTATLDDTSLTEFEGTAGPAVEGSLLDGSGSGGVPDSLPEDGLAVLEIDIDGSGNFVAVTDGMEVVGQYGTLTINADGSYSYQANDDAGAVGKVDSFAYKLVHPAAGEADASLHVQIGSPESTLVWDDADPSAPATTVVANDDSGSAGIEVVNQVTTATEDNAIEYSWLMGVGGIVLGDTDGSTSITLAADTLTDLTININVGSLASLLDSVDFQLVRIEGGVETVVMDRDQASLLDLIGIFGDSVEITVENLEAGSYRLDVSNGSLVSLPGGVAVDLTYETTHLTVDVPGTLTNATGNVFADDTLGSDYTTLAVEDDLGAFVMPGAGGVTVSGDYGELTIMSNGDYTYTPYADLASIGSSDTFVYQLQHPNGDTVTANLVISIEEDGGAGITTTSILAEGASLDDGAYAGTDDVIALESLDGEHGTDVPDTSATDGTSGEYSVESGLDELIASLTELSDAGDVAHGEFGGLRDGEETSAPALDMAADDTLAYLPTSSVDDPEHTLATQQSVI